MARGTRIRIGIALAAAALVAGCGTQRATPSPAGGAPPAGDAQVVQVRATEFGFSPGTIRVTAGQPVRLVLTNGGQIEHDLRVEKVPASGIKLSEAGHGHGAGEVAAHTEKGTQAWVEFTPTKPGTYELVCTIAGHKDAGMKGQLVVA